MAQTPNMGSYSFLDVLASITGKGGSFSISAAGVSDEGIRIDMVRDKNTMTIGAGGDGMHSLIASKAGRVTVSLLKTAPGNAQLSQLYNFQSSSSANWGNNTLTISNPVSGDSIVCSGGAFVRQSPVGYSSEGGMMNWAFDFIQIDEILGNGFQVTGLSS